jgi:hypothetical protein
MNTDRLTSPWALRWTLGLVVLWESYEFAFSAAEAKYLGHMRLPSCIGPVLGCTEILAALLFLVLKVSRIGGFFLLVIFAIAATRHLLHGQYEVGSLLVYGAAVLTCLPRNAGLSSGSTS